MVQSEVGYVTQVRQKPLPIWSSSRNEPSDWSISPAVTLPAQVEQATARHEYGRSMPSSSAWSSTYVSSAHSILDSLPSSITSVTSNICAGSTRAATREAATLDTGAVKAAAWETSARVAAAE